jgi:hypothetical protein
MPKRRAQRGGDLRDDVLEKYARNTGKTRKDAEDWANRNGLFQQKHRGVADFFRSFARGAETARRVGEGPIKDLVSNPTNLLNPLKVGKAASDVVNNTLTETGRGKKRRRKR